MVNPSVNTELTAQGEQKNKKLSQRYFTYKGYRVLWERAMIRKFLIPG